VTRASIPLDGTVDRRRSGIVTRGSPGAVKRLALGSLAGVPLGLITFRHADPSWCGRRSGP
jgi:hypothetical protein